VLRLGLIRLCHLLFIGACFGLLAVPLVTHNWRRDPGIVSTENREAASPPVWPRSWRALTVWPKQADAYLADHFGQRTAMVKAFNRIRYRLFGETPNEQTVFGLHGRLFFTSHSAASPYSLISFICGFGVDDAMLQRVAADLNTFLQQANSWVSESYLMVVPTSATLYFKDLPHWLQAQCPPANTMDRLLLRLPQGELRSRLLYPLSAMLAAKSQGEVIPLTNFHWMGLGAEVAAASFAEGRLGLPRRMAFPTREEIEPSDIAHFIPGIPTGNVVRLPDFNAAGVDYCWGARCFPEWSSMAEVISDLSRVRSPRAGDKKLLILSDSFGKEIAGWFAPYFGSVWHFSVSNLGRLPADEQQAFRRHIFTEYRPDMVLYVFHDGSIDYGPRVFGTPAISGR
jgi:hypothetical protein